MSAEIDSLEKRRCQAPTTRSDSKHLPGKRLVTKAHRAAVRGRRSSEPPINSTMTASVELSYPNHLNNLIYQTQRGRTGLPTVVDIIVGVSMAGYTKLLNFIYPKRLNFHF